MTEEATIKIRRKQQRFLLGWAISGLYVFVDGVKLGTCGNGKEETFKLSAGSHSVVVRTKSIYSSNGLNVNLSPGDAKSLNCGYKMGFHLMPVLIPAPLLLWAGLTSRPFAQFPELAWLTPQPSWVQPALILFVVYWFACLWMLWRPGIALYLTESKD